MYLYFFKAYHKGLGTRQTNNETIYSISGPKMIGSNNFYQKDSVLILVCRRNQHSFRIQHFSELTKLLIKDILELI